MKKFFGVLCVLALLSIPVVAQDYDSLPVPISLTITVSSGANLVPDITALTWTDLPAPLVSEWVDANELITWEISWRSVSGTSQQLVCQLTSPITNGVESMDSEENIQQIWTGFVEATLPGPPADGITQQMIKAFVTSGGSGIATLQMQYWNKVTGLTEAITTYAGEFTYTLMTNI